MIHFCPHTFDITSFYLSLFTCTYKMLSWWLVVWLVGSATTEKKDVSARKKKTPQVGNSRRSAIQSSVRLGIEGQLKLTQRGEPHQVRSISILLRELERKQTFGFPVWFRWKWVTA